MAKGKDRRIDEFRNEAMAFVSEHFHDMEDAFKAYIEKKDWDKAVSLYMKMADKVIPSLPTQAADTGAQEKPDWQVKIEQAKRTIEKEVK